MSNQREKKRQQITEAASELFGLYGYSVSMDAIAKLANVSKQTLYSHFEKKEGLFVECMKEKVVRYQINKLAFDRSKPIAEVLFSFACDFHMHLLKPGPVQIYRNAVSQIENLPDFSATYLEQGPQKTLIMMSEYLEDKIKDGSISLDISTEDAAMQLLLMFHGKAVYWHYLGADVDESQEQKHKYLKSCINMFLGSVAKEHS